LTFLIDANVISEKSKPRGDPKVLRWIAAATPADTFISVLTLGEVLHGVERLPPGAKRRSLEHWLQHDVLQFFAGRILHVDDHIAMAWGKMVARAGRTLSTIDSWLAATAQVHNLILVTRNERHVAGLGVPVLNPWT
jgi:predicted nucleic acid-binding protein